MSSHVSDELLPGQSVRGEWSPVRLGESGDRVYRRSDGAAYAKVSAGRGAALLDEERRRTEWLADFGLGSPIVLDWIVSEDGACLVTSPVSGVPASELTTPELFGAWASLAERLKSLHELPAEGCPFDRGLAKMFDRAADLVGRNAVNPAFLAPDLRQVAPSILLAAVEREVPERLAQEACDLVVCHGDACLPNLMVDRETLRCVGLIDLGRLGTADRYADLALLVGNARESWAGPEDAQAAHDRLFEVLDIPAPDAVRLDFYLRLDPLTWG